ncbi:MAG: hypothetical protein ABIK38_00515 [candidate division WOR-3 bacterium]
MIVQGPKANGLGERMRRAISAGRSRSYWVWIAFLGAVAVLLVFIFGWGRSKTPPIKFQLSGPKPDFTIMEVQEMPAGRQDWLTVKALADSGMTLQELQRVFDWIIAEMLDDYHRLKRRQLRVIWVYLYNQPDLRPAYWRAMAVYADPRLPAAQLPDAARLGGDAVKIGAVTYDFINPLTAGGE